MYHQYLKGFILLFQRKAICYNWRTGVSTVYQNVSKEKWLCREINVRHKIRYYYMCSPYGFLLWGYNTEKDGVAASGRQTVSIIMQFAKRKKRLSTKMRVHVRFFSPKIIAQSISKALSHMWVKIGITHFLNIIFTPFHEIFRSITRWYDLVETSTA